MFRDAVQIIELVGNPPFWGFSGGVHRYMFLGCTANFLEAGSFQEVVVGVVKVH
jgi:hypothetical protein